MQATFQTSIEPWLTINATEKALAFYKNAFGAVETYRFADPGVGLVVRLSINGTQFWVSGDGNENEGTNSSPLGGDNMRMILIVNNPENIFKKAIEEGAKEVFTVGEEHGWKLGRICDPFGLHWEIGYEL